MNNKSFAEELFNVRKVLSAKCISHPQPKELGWHWIYCPAMGGWIIEEVDDLDFYKDNPKATKFIKVIKPSEIMELL